MLGISIRGRGCGGARLPEPAQTLRTGGSRSVIVACWGRGGATFPEVAVSQKTSPALLPLLLSSVPAAPACLLQSYRVFCLPLLSPACPRGHCRCLRPCAKFCGHLAGRCSRGRGGRNSRGLCQELSTNNPLPRSSRTVGELFHLGAGLLQHHFLDHSAHLGEGRGELGAQLLVAPSAGQAVLGTPLVLLPLLTVFS